MTHTPTPPLDDDARWTAVLDRDGRYDAAFVYAVASTGVFCRPSCPSRRPRRDRVVFFADAAAARAAGYRACRRCGPGASADGGEQADWVRRVCLRIEDEDGRLPTLAELAAVTGIGPDRLRRMFKKATGLSPRQYADSVRRQRLREEIRNGESVTSALYGAGYGSSSRLYENAATHLGMTPASYAKGGRGARIAFATAACPHGRVLVAATERGLCAVSLGDADDELEAALRRDLPAAAIRRDTGALAAHLAAIVAFLNGTEPLPQLPLDIRATVFQRQVWERLRAIPPGATRTYAEIAAEIGRPGAARAVGRACAVNPVSVVVPCHRAVGADGSLTGYRWGVDRKRRLLEGELTVSGKGEDNESTRR